MERRSYYAVFVPEDGGKVSVWFPDVPGCTTWGEDLEHAFAQALDALEGHLESLADDGETLPVPSCHEDAWGKVRCDFAKEGAEMPPQTLLQLVPVPDMQEKPVRVNVSFRRSALAMIDRKAEAVGMTRSGFLSRAAESYRTGA